jgi:two-component system, chemotaxis family, chemotaxis protein CheY
MAKRWLFARIRLTTMKILLVEDNAEMRRLLKSMVEKIAAEVFEAGDAGQAIELYRAERPDWVLMDIFMQPTDGFTATREIKSLDPEARVVFVSSHTDKRTRQAAHEAGGAAFFGKDDLMSLIEFLKGQL